MMTTIAMVADVSHVLKLANRLNDQRVVGDSCDILLKVKGHALPTHSCVLSAVSPFFRQLIDVERQKTSSGCKSSRTFPHKIDLVVPGHSMDKKSGGLEALTDLLDYIYTGKIELKDSSVGLVVKLAEAFMLYDLSALIKAQVDSEKLAEFLTYQPNKPPKSLSRLSTCTRFDSSRKQPTLTDIFTKQTSSPNNLSSRSLRSSTEADTSKVHNKLTVDTATTSLTDTLTGSIIADLNNISSNEIAPSGNNQPTTITNINDNPTNNVDNVTNAVCISTGRQRKRNKLLDGITDVSQKKKMKTRKKTADNCMEDDTASDVDKNVVDEPKRKRRNKSKPPVFRMSRANLTFTCRTCGFASADRTAIRQHLSIHPGSSYVCVSCDFVSHYSSKLLTHLRESEHELTTKCSLCFHEADNVDDLRQHLTTHDHPLPFPCGFCDKRFPSRWGWKTHLRCHTLERPFVCDICHVGFKQKVALTTHMVKHNGNKTSPSGKRCLPGQKLKNYLCDYCGFTTPYSYRIRMHEREHNGMLFECHHENCSYKASSKHLLQSHLLFHSNEKLHQCEVCGKSYKDPSTFRQHRKIHNQEAHQIHCEHCTFASLRQDRVKRHTARVHGHKITFKSDRSSKPKVEPIPMVQPNSELQIGTVEIAEESIHGIGPVEESVIHSESIEPSFSDVQSILFMRPVIEEGQFVPSSNVAQSPLESGIEVEPTVESVIEEHIVEFVNEGDPIASENEIQCIFQTDQEVQILVTEANCENMTTLETIFYIPTS